MSSLQDYYQRNKINPGEIALDTEERWRAHVAKRTNLFENHLHIPLRFLLNKSVLEFGCASGENALVLADAGAHLTLIEPNEAMHPRLLGLFERFNVRHRLHGFHKDDIGS
jgi:predicted O-methyltransferase YrrM